AFRRIRRGRPAASRNLWPASAPAAPGALFRYGKSRHSPQAADGLAEGGAARHDPEKCETVFVATNAGKARLRGDHARKSMIPKSVKRFPIATNALGALARRSCPKHHDPEKWQALQMHRKNGLKCIASTPSKSWYTAN